MPNKLITGPTFALREHFKCLRGEWNPDAKGWEIPDEYSEEAQAILEHYRQTYEKLPVRACQNPYHRHPADSQAGSAAQKAHTP